MSSTASISMSRFIYLIKNSKKQILVVKTKCVLAKSTETKCFRCCKMHDWCYDATECRMFSEYFVPYYWRCYHGYKPVCGSFFIIIVLL